MTGSTRIYVGHLPYDVRAEEIEKFFEKIAPVKDMMVKSDKGYAFVVSFVI
jgi:RNA recognition motif-containing protein